MLENYFSKKGLMEAALSDESTNSDTEEKDEVAEETPQTADKDQNHSNVHNNEEKMKNID